MSCTIPQAAATTVSWADVLPRLFSCITNVPCILQVFEDTSLSAVYAATNQPTQQQLQAMQPLLEAASAATGSSVPLPRIQHAAGFDKYKDLAPGEAAHEAGYGKAYARCADQLAGTISATQRNLSHPTKAFGATSKGTARHHRQPSSHL